MEKKNPDLSFIWKFGWPILVLALVWGVRSFGPGSESGAGKNLYLAHCSNCHMDDGKGLVKLIPPLADADFVFDKGDELACIIRNGMTGPVEVNGVTFNTDMPANDRLRDVEIAAIINYIRTAWGNDATAIPFSEIESQLKSCK